jgi:hypothetical protein
MTTAVKFLHSSLISNPILSSMAARRLIVGDRPSTVNGQFRFWEIMKRKYDRKRTPNHRKHSHHALWHLKYSLRLFRKRYVSIILIFSFCPSIRIHMVQSQRNGHRSICMTVVARFNFRASLSSLAPYKRKQMVCPSFPRSYGRLCRRRRSDERIAGMESLRRQQHTAKNLWRTLIQFDVVI